MHLNHTGDGTSGKDRERTRRMDINTLAFGLPQHGAFNHVDADCVGIMGNLEWKYNRQWAALLEMSGKPLFISAKPGILTKEQERDLTSILIKASGQKGHVVLMDWQYKNYPEIWKEGKIMHRFQWYEETRVAFLDEPERYQTFLSIS